MEGAQRVVSLHRSQTMRGKPYVEIGSFSSLNRLRLALLPPSEGERLLLGVFDTLPDAERGAESVVH